MFEEEIFFFWISSETDRNYRLWWQVYSARRLWWWTKTDFIRSKEWICFLFQRKETLPPKWLWVIEGTSRHYSFLRSNTSSGSYLFPGRLFFFICELFFSDFLTFRSETVSCSSSSISSCITFSSTSCFFCRSSWRRWWWRWSTQRSHWRTGRYSRIIIWS